MKIFNLPDLGEGLPDAEIREWHIKEGDEVKVDQPLVSMETAKALVDVPSPYSGRIEKLFGQPGDIVQTGHPLVGFEGTETSENLEDAGTVVGNIEIGHQVLQESPTGVQIKTTETNIKITPAVRTLAKQLGVDLQHITASGPGGSITVQDVKKAHEKMTSAPSQAEGFETLHGAKRFMAINMAQAHASVVPVTIMDDADIQHFKENEDITLRLIHALITACKTEPNLNSYFDGKTLSQKHFSEVNVGIAIDTPKGLYVPVIKNAEQLNSEQLRSKLNEFKTLAQKQEFPPELLHDATITLSNFGVFVGRYASPIVVPPSVAIIAVGKLREAVVAIAGKAEIHRILPISLTFDHRAVTGGEAARFLAAFIGNLEK